ncbi:MAG: hypothetical protein ABI614_11570 [Planctomycetota bacterium]
MPSRPNRRTSWKGIAVVAIVLLAGLAIWVAPRRTERVVPADASISWDDGQAPPRRAIVWRSPGTFTELLPPEAGDAVALAPRFSEGATALYCTVRDGGGQADIYRARLAAGNWGQLSAVPALNSVTEDGGAFVTGDDGEVFLYSDRPGGFGGFDLYVAERLGDDWGPPRNLGPKINTPANESDPALSVDGRTLYFASNRTESMIQQAADATDGEESTRSATRQGHPGMSHLDVYAANRNSTDSAWQSAEPLTKLNRDDSDERAPFLSPDGVHLYFASNRLSRAKGLRDLDIYAARRVGDRFELPENIGAPINTPADETQPALSPEGFTLLFSSDRAGADAIYASRAMQVFEEVAWDTSRLALLYRMWPLALLITIAVVVLAAGALQLRGWVAETATSARFFAGSVVFHLLLLLALTFWSLPTVVSVIISKIQEAEAASQPFDDNQHQSHEDGQEAWEKLADLAAVDKAIDLIRRETEPINIPNDTERLEPTIPIEMARLLPTDQVLYTPPSEPAELSEPQQITARSMALPAAAIEMAETVEAILPPTQPTAELPDVAQQFELQRAETKPVATSLELPESVVVVPRSAELSLTPPSDTPQLNAPMQNPITTRRESVVVQQAVEITDATTAPVLPLTSATEMPAQVQEQIQLSRTTPTRPAPALSQPVEVSSDRPATALPEAVRDIASQAKPTEPDRNLARARPMPNVTADLGASEPMEASPPQPATPQSLADAGALVELNRADVKPPQIEVPTPQEMSGPDRGERRVLVGELSEVQVDLPPQFGPIVSRLQRPRAKATHVVYAADSVGLREMFTLRQSDIRKQYIELFDGSQESEQAVNQGLVWLVTHQNQNGSWSLNNFHANCKDKHPNCSGAGSAKSDTAATGLALLPLLASGNTHRAGEYQQQVAAAIKWLTEAQKENGNLLSPGDQQPLYSHAIASIALCEAYGMTGDPELKPRAEKALDFLIKAQHAGTGGWRYNPNEAADTSVVGWAVMALKSGEMAGIPVPQATFDNVARWLATVEGNKPLGGGAFGYQNANPTPAMTAEGLLCLQFMGADRNDPRMRAGADYLLKHLPEPEQRLTSYYWYYGTQVMYHMQGEYWQVWNEKLRDHLVQTQVKDGTLTGTWDPRDNWEKSGGRIYATAAKLLMLEVYYRHLPLYEQLDE